MLRPPEHQRPGADGRQQILRFRTAVDVDLGGDERFRSKAIALAAGFQARRGERAQCRKDASLCKTVDFGIRSRHRLAMLLYFVAEDP